MGEAQSRGSKDPQDSGGVLQVDGRSWSGEQHSLVLTPISYLGKGAFGTVQKVLLQNEHTGETGIVALKKKTHWGQRG